MSDLSTATFDELCDELKKRADAIVIVAGRVYEERPGRPTYLSRCNGDLSWCLGLCERAALNIRDELLDDDLNIDDDEVDI